MQIPVLLDRSSAVSLTTQIVEQLRHAIAQARLPEGTRLPSSRRLSDQLEVARNTVLRAYDLLLLEGLVESRPASGIFVRRGAHARPAAADARRPEQQQASWSMPLPSLPIGMLQRGTQPGRTAFDFLPGRAHQALFPLKLWRRLIQQNLSHGGQKGLVQGVDAAGLPGLRCAIAVHLATTRGIVADPGRILIVSSAQEAIAIVSRLFLHRGTLAALEDPGSQAAFHAFGATGSEIVGVAVDEDGLVPEDLPRRPTAVLHVTPSHQFPTGATLSAARRDGIAAWARRSGCYVIEDDTDAEFRFDGPNPHALAAVAPDCTVYLGSFAQTLGAGLGLGFMVVPQQLAEIMAAAKALLGSGQPWLEQAALADMMAGSSYATHVTRVRAHYRENRDVLLAALRRHFGEVSVTGGSGGLHLLWHLPAGVPDAPIVEDRARRSRIGVYPFAPGGAVTLRPSLLPRRAVLLGFGAMLPKQIDQGIARLSDAIDDAVDNPGSDVTAYLVEAPSAPQQVGRRSRRASVHLDPRFRQPLALSDRARGRAVSLGTAAKRTGSDMASVVSIHRYPIKGLSAQSLSRVETEAGRPIPFDRVFALARPTAPIDRDDPKWAKKGLFAMLMLDEGLAQVATELDVERLWLTVRRSGRQVAAGSLIDVRDREALAHFFWTLLPSFKDPPVLVRSRGGHFMDKPDNVISLINLATLRDLESRWNVKLDPLRFRANLYIDGAVPWEEVGWVGRDIRIGGTTFAVDRVNGRCGATNVDPATGRRDLDIPSALRAAFGHKNLGIYLIAKRPGAIEVGDRVETPEAGEDAGTRSAPQLAAGGTRARFMCRGCYFVFDEGAGLPGQGLPPNTPFDAVPRDWRCPDCGGERSLFAPQ